MLYCLVDTAGGVVRYQDFDTPPPALAPDKGLRWLPVVESGADQPFDPAAQVREMTETVTADSVERCWTVRTRTAEERLADCHAARRAAYPDLREQIEALTESAAGRPEKLAAILAAIAAVKAAWPKPAA